MLVINSQQIEPTNQIIDSWKIELESYYGIFIDLKILKRSFYFAMGNTYQIGTAINHPFINHGEVIDCKSTLKRELLINAYSILMTGFEFPKGYDSKEYQKKVIDCFFVT